MAKIVDAVASSNSIIEKQYILNISQYIYDGLSQLGLDVKFLSCEVLNTFGNTNDVIINLGVRTSSVYN